MTNKTKHCNIPIFLPELACPHQCVFCNQEDISSTYNLPNENEIRQTIKNHINTIPKGTEIQIAFFGGNFTGISIDEQTKYLNLAQEYINKGLVHGIRFSTRPDYISPKIMEHLKQYSINEIELGAQSFDEEVLRISERGINPNDIRKASKLILKAGYRLGLQMMIGLPEDTFEKSLNTAKCIIECGAHSTRIYPTLVIKNTTLATYFKQGIYKPLDISTAIEWCSELYPLFQKSDIKVLRMGLHPNSEFENDNVLLAGPYHPSFKELVLSHIWKKRFEQIPLKKGKLSIKVSNNDIPYAVGYGSENKTWLKKTTGWIQIIGNSNIKENDFTYSYN